MSNEIIYEIFKFIDGYDLYEAFSNLNSRLTNLLTDPILPLNFDVSFMSKLTVQHCYTEILVPNKHRIKCLYIMNPFIVDLICVNPCVISQFYRLETLVINNFRSKHLEDILKSAALLPRLCSLVITFADYTRSKSRLYRLIFCLPKLKYCKLSYEECADCELLEPCINQCSSLEHLVIDSSFDLSEIHHLSTYTPQLRRLCCHSLSCLGDINTNMLITPNSLTQVALNLKLVNFDQFERLIRSHFSRLQLLRISTSDDITYLNAQHWQQLILIFMPSLRIFDFQHTHILDNIRPVQDHYHSLINQFKTSFWFERQWFFEHQHSSQEYLHYAIFYSTQPYRLVILTY